MKAGWQIDFSEYADALERASVDVNQVSREALAEAASVLQAAMVAACPTAKLRPYIKVFTPSAEGDYNYVAVGYVRDAAYTPAEIAILANSVEFGTTHSPPLPHIRPAVRKLRAAVKGLIANRLIAAGYVDGGGE
ncbi:MAG: hypothetical protein LC130_17035 [Bryobacterales bacterium]|nr:hypothetical protein [Bryobacterales bacterium]MCZ2288578.1 hypothetical protein [Anaerolineales bacterium]